MIDIDMETYWSKLPKDERAGYLEMAQTPDQDKDSILEEAMVLAWSNSEYGKEEAEARRKHVAEEREAERNRTVSCSSCSAEVTPGTSMKSGPKDYFCASCLVKDGLGHLVSWQ